MKPLSYTKQWREVFSFRSGRNCKVPCHMWTDERTFITHMVFCISNRISCHYIFPAAGCKTFPRYWNTLYIERRDVCTQEKCITSFSRALICLGQIQFKIFQPKISRDVGPRKGFRSFVQQFSSSYNRRNFYSMKRLQCIPQYAE